uniref:Rhodanese domain-containing protein n=1 Tax=Rhodosorus marinus TaxID=101924 RepID=A0A7S3A5V4_9RHOD|mmetsp:Transcript_4381/g.18648  ORF Transcript_4381/g.18648 Transcript_4381/m.18648 type:complete len:775 (+) Transcript_4381:92-2416(+)
MEGFVFGNGIVSHKGRSQVCYCRRLIVKGSLAEGSRDNARARRKSTAKRLREVSEQIRDELKHTVKSPVKISVPYEVWKPLGLSPKLKLVRIFIDKEFFLSLPEFKHQVLQQMIRLFPALSFHPKFVLLPDEKSFKLLHAKRVLETDEDLMRARDAAEEAGDQLMLTLEPLKMPNLPETDHVPEPDLLKFLKEQGDDHVTALSFYRFVDIEQPEFVMNRSRRVLSALGVKGRVYIAKEGINAQLCVPSNLLSCLELSLADDPAARGDDLAEIAEWANRWVPREIRGAFLNVDREVTFNDTPFVDLRIKVRAQVLSDGLEKPLDWSSNGTAVSPEEWHQKLESDEDVILLDCRNKYESQVGKFESAKALDTSTFRESWDWLRKELEGTKKDKRIMTYCTGGIRCVKVGAFLEQEMGFKNVDRLEGGIVAYSRFVRNKGLESQFKGVNYVFDLRLGERVTSDVLTQCLNCGAKCDTQTDCANERCRRPFADRHFVQCPECAAQLKGCCSEDCRQCLSTDSSQPVGNSVSSNRSDRDEHSDLLEEYSREYSTPEPLLMRDLQEATQEAFPSRAHMVCGPVVGHLLKSVVSMTRSSRVLELGTFTGYSSLWIASGLSDHGELLTCDIDPEAIEIARTFYDRSTVSDKINVRLNAADDVLEELVDSKAEPFDVVFLDANKAKYKSYYDKILESNILRIGGVMIIDNVLFKGGVPFLHDQYSDDSTLSQQLRRRRTNSIHEAGRLARKMHEFNVHVRNDPRTEQLMLPLRDGLTIATRVS